MIVFIDRSPGLININKQAHLEYAEEQELEHGDPDEGREEESGEGEAQQQVRHTQVGIEQRLREHGYDRDAGHQRLGSRAFHLIDHQKDLHHACA